jgi:hypothetical protein
VTLGANPFESTTMSTAISFNNVNTPDRIIRAIAGVLLLQAAYFWLAGTEQLVAYAAGAVMLATALLRFCPIYRIFGISTVGSSAKAPSAAMAIVGVVLVLGAAAGGTYASNFFTRKLFLEDFNAMNDAYKQTLFLTGKGEREKAITQYDRLLPAYQAFKSKYSAYQPYALKSDGQLGADLKRVNELFASVNDKVRTGDLHQAHLDLEKVRPVWQDMFKRNGFSMLSVALVDFHDAMELMLDAANAKDAPKLIALYPQVSDKLKAVEAESNDAEIQAIRKNLDDLAALAKDVRLGELPAKGEALKSSFVKVYLVRG